MLSVISGPATDPSTSDKAEAGGLMSTSHDREFLTINLIQTNHQERKWQDKLLYPSLSPLTPHTKPLFIFSSYISWTNKSRNKVNWRNNKWSWCFWNINVPHYEFLAVQCCYVFVWMYDIRNMFWRSWRTWQFLVKFTLTLSD